MNWARRYGWWWLVPAALFASVAVGQLVRIQPFSGRPAALLAVDLGLITFNLFWLIYALVGRQLRDVVRTTWRHPVWKWSVWFLLWAAVTLLINAPNYSASQDLVAVSYLGRLALAFGVMWWSSYYAKRLLGLHRKLFVGLAVAMLVLGFGQFIFYYDFRFMVAKGWDPHYGRMLATFFDPNYFGIFLVLVMTFALGQSFGEKPGRRRWGWLLLFAVAWSGLFLAYSRSAWLAGMIAIPAMTWRHSKRGALLLTVAFIGALLIPNRLGQRFADSQGIINQKNYSDGKYQCDDAASASCDISGSQRVISLRKGLELSLHHPLFGVGYNAYGYALVQDKLEVEKRLESRAAQGSDSSLLNVLATTGVIGLLLFLTWLGTILRRLHQLSAGRRPEHWLAHGLFWFTISWLVVSFFNNALLYVLILIPWAALTAPLIGLTKRRA